MDRIITELAVIDVGPEGLVLKEVAPGLAVADVIARTGAVLIVPPHVLVMPIDQYGEEGLLRIAV